MQKSPRAKASQAHDNSEWSIRSSIRVFSGVIIVAPGRPKIIIFQGKNLNFLLKNLHSY